MKMRSGLSWPSLISDLTSAFTSTMWSISVTKVRLLSLFFVNMIFSKVLWSCFLLSFDLTSIDYAIKLISLVSCLGSGLMSRVARNSLKSEVARNRFISWLVCYIIYIRWFFTLGYSIPRFSIFIGIGARIDGLFDSDMSAKALFFGLSSCLDLEVDKLAFVNLGKNRKILGWSLGSSIRIASEWSRIIF